MWRRAKVSVTLALTLAGSANALTGCAQGGVDPSAADARPRPDAAMAIDAPKAIDAAVIDARPDAPAPPHAMVSIDASLLCSANSQCGFAECCDLFGDQTCKLGAVVAGICIPL